MSLPQLEGQAQYWSMGQRGPCSHKAGEAPAREMAEVFNPEEQRVVAGIQQQGRKERDEKVTGLEQPGISEAVQGSGFYFLFGWVPQLLFVLFLGYPSDSTGP